MLLIKYGNYKHKYCLLDLYIDKCKVLIQKKYEERNLIHKYSKAFKKCALFVIVSRKATIINNKDECDAFKRNYKACYSEKKLDVDSLNFARILRANSAFHD